LLSSYEKFGWLRDAYPLYSLHDSADRIVPTIKVFSPWHKKGTKIVSIVRRYSARDMKM
jgi:hypothetical protein